VVDGVGQAAFEAAAGFVGGLAFGDLAEVVVAAGSGVTGLGDGDDVDRAALLAAGRQFGHRLWAIEGCQGVGRHLPSGWSPSGLSQPHAHGGLHR
jgi:hypothetical protein